MNKKFNVYKSSAGSGKTFTLVKIFLRLCLSSDKKFAFSNILAITFTNKATYEMKERILEMLKALSEGNGDVMREKLIEETGLTSELLSKKSQLVLTAILHNYEDFSISTIDKFSHRIIRTFAKDLNLALNFQVELEEKELLREIIDQLINEVGRNKSISKLLLDFAFSKVEDEKSWKLEEDLLAFAQYLLKEQSNGYLIPLRKLKEEDFRELERSYSSLNKLFKEGIVPLADEGLGLIKNAGIEKASLAGGGAILAYLKRVSNFETSNLSPTATLRKNVDVNKWHSAKCTAEQKHAIDGVSESLTKFFYRIQEIVDADYKDYLSRNEVLKNYQKLILINQIEKKFAAYKKEEDLLNISDFNKLIAEVVLNEPLPFIYERLGERYQNLMIDEFQDTSVLQFLNLLPLIEESLAKGNENLIVGDAKQAIYRFRGGEVDQFSEMPEYVPEMVKDNQLILQKLLTLKAQFNQENLAENYRSAEAVVQFNNSFFDYIKSLNISEKVNSIYQGHEQKVTKKPGTGYVSITFQKGKADELILIYGGLVIENIKNCLIDGFELKDIAVLCRKRKQATAIADQLKQEGISILSSEVLLLKNSSAIKILISMLNWLVDPQSDLHQKNIVEYLVDEKLIKASKAIANRKYLGGGNDFKVAFCDAGIDLNADRLKSSSIVELIESLVRAFSLTTKYDVYIQTLLDEAMDFTKSYGSDLIQFLAWWDENDYRLSATVPEEVNAVTILTIHKSKGLEYPVVIYPFADSDLGSRPSGSELIWTHLPKYPPTKVPFALVEYNKDLKNSSLAEVYEIEREKKEIDLINDTYVAFTRASERLYVHSQHPSKTSTNLNLKSLLNDFVTQSKTFTELDDRFEMGEINKYESEDLVKGELKADSIILNYISEDWKKRLRLSTESVKVNFDSEEHRRYGELVHEVFASITDSSELNRVLKDYVLKGVLTNDEALQLESKLVQLLSRVEVSDFFSTKYKSKREATLFNSTGKILRPDRVIYFEDHLAVLDFKTGYKNESYAAQVNEYCTTLSETTELPVKGYLLYTELEELVEV